MFIKNTYTQYIYFQNVNADICLVCHGKRKSMDTAKKANSAVSRNNNM